MKSLLFTLATLTTLTIATNNIVAINNINNLSNQNNSQFSNLYVIGDSLSDTGGLAGAGTDFVKDNWLIPAKSVKLDAPFYQNSYTNGDPAAKVLANLLHINLSAGWKFNANFKTYNRYGNNYAVAGAFANKYASYLPILNNFGLDDQVDALMSQHKIQNNDLTFIDIGNVDVLLAIEAPTTFIQEHIINSAINNEKANIEKLIAAGNHHLAIANIPDIGTTARYLNSPKHEMASKISKEYDQKWEVMIKDLQAKYNNYIKAIHIDQIFEQAISAFKKLGGITDLGATEPNWDNLYETGEITAPFVGKANLENINNYFFFDGIHPNKWGHNFAGNMIYQAIKNW